MISAGKPSSAESKRALEKLCETYWTPLYAYCRRRVNTVAEAQDLTQAFFVAFLEKNYAETASPSRGRFRAFLLTAFKHFLSKEWEKAKTQKRGGQQSVLSLDFSSADSSLKIDPASTLTPEQIYDQQWAITLLARVLANLGNEYRDAGEGARFAQLQPFLIGDNTGITYATVATNLQMNEAAVRKAVSRLRSRYRQLLRNEIAQTVDSPDEIDGEIRNLFRTFQL